MTRNIFTLLLTISFIPFANAQTYKVVHLADSLLKSGVFNAAITTYEFPKEIKSLQEKALANLKNNPQWSDKYVVIQVQKGRTDIPKLLDAYGLTEEEFQKMLAGFKSKQEAVLSEVIPITVKKINGIISFQSSGKLSLFNYIRIDTRNSLIYFDNLRDTKEIEISGKLYAPLLKGVEAHWSEPNGTAKTLSDVTEFGIAIGMNDGDTRPALCLIYAKKDKDQSAEQPKFLNITLVSKFKY